MLVPKPKASVPPLLAFFLPFNHRVWRSDRKLQGNGKERLREWGAVKIWNYKKNSLGTQRMSSVFAAINQRLEERQWSLRYWDGRPTGFFSEEEGENLLQEALENNDVPSLNFLVDEVHPDVLVDVADLITDYAYPEELEWYMTQRYQPLVATLTPERFVASVDLQDALATWQQNLYVYYPWWQSLSDGASAIGVLAQIFEEGSLPEVRSQPLNLPLNEWRAAKKARFFQDRAAQGYVNPVATGPASLHSPPAVRRPARLPSRQR